MPYDGTEPLASLPHALAGALDRALNTALGHAASATQHVYKITPVSGMCVANVDHFYLFTSFLFIEL